jgi:hypothetical protein
MSDRDVLERQCELDSILANNLKGGNMKKFIVAAALVLCALGAHASILLTTPYALTGPTGGATPNAGSAPNATATSKTYDWQANVACVTYSYGTVTVNGTQDTGFTVLPGAPTILSCLNLSTGVIQVSLTNGPIFFTTTLTGAQLTSAINVYTGPLTALRDAADLYASKNFLPGTQPDTW